MSDRRYSSSIKKREEQSQQHRSHFDLFFQEQVELIQMLSEGWSTPSTGFTRQQDFLEFFYVGRRLDS